MTNEKSPNVAEALQAWRDAERISIRASAQREAADEAVAAAGLAEEAAGATAKAAEMAMVAATEASRAATATAEAASRILIATRTEGDARRLREEEAQALEVEAEAAHKAAVKRADERYGRTSGD